MQPFLLKHITQIFLYFFIWHLVDIVWHLLDDFVLTYWFATSGFFTFAFLIPSVLLLHWGTDAVSAQFTTPHDAHLSGILSTLPEENNTPLPHRPSKTEHFGSWSQSVLTSQLPIFLEDLKYTAAHSVIFLFIILLHGQKISSSFLDCVPHYQKLKKYIRVLPCMDSCNHINQSQMRVWISFTAFPLRHEEWRWFLYKDSFYLHI